MTLASTFQNSLLGNFLGFGPQDASPQDDNCWVERCAVDRARRLFRMTVRDGRGHMYRTVLGEKPRNCSCSCGASPRMCCPHLIAAGEYFLDHYADGRGDGASDEEDEDQD